MAKKEPLTLEGLTDLINRSLEETKHEERITTDMLRDVYGRIRKSYNIYGLKSVTEDPNVKQLIKLLPADQEKEILVASLDVYYDTSDSPYSFVPCDVPMEYLVIDFNRNSIVTGFEAYDAYGLKGKKKVPKA